MVWRGFANSRLTGEPVAAGEFIMDGVKWPYGYVDHYIRDHNVMPTKRFYEFIKLHAP